MYFLDFECIGVLQKLWLTVVLQYCRKHWAAFFFFCEVYFEALSLLHVLHDAAGEVCLKWSEFVSVKQLKIQTHFCVMAVWHKNVKNSSKCLKIKIQISCMKLLFPNFLVNFEWEVSCSSWNCLRSYLANSWNKWNTCVLEKRKEEKDPQLFHHFISYE